MSLHEIILPETKPETEWIRGRAVQKMSPVRDHGRLQLYFAMALERWARGRGEVATEWRFRVPVPGEVVRPLVPDISYVSGHRLAPLSHEELQAPLMAPDVAAEIRSPGDSRRDLDAKIRDLLRAGTALVIVIDADARTVSLHDAAASTHLNATAILTHSAVPGFALDLAEFFEDALGR